MNLFAQQHRVVETETRRALAAIRLVSAVSGLPIVTPAVIVPRSATVAQGDAVPPLRLRHDQTRIHQNQTGLFVLTAAPLFEDYAQSFEPPDPPPGTTPQPLVIAFDILPHSPRYLPRSFAIALPRSNDRNAPTAAARPIDVPIFPSPAAPTASAGSSLRIAVSRQGVPAPGVLVSVFRAPRQASDTPLARGLSDWRGRLAGETLVEFPSLPRFRAGDGANVIETDHAIEIEAVRDPDFIPTSSPPPDPDRLALPTTPGLAQFTWAQIAPSLVIEPVSNPASIRSGQSYTARFSIP